MLSSKNEPRWLPQQDVELAPIEAHVAEKTESSHPSPANPSSQPSSSEKSAPPNEEDYAPPKGIGLLQLFTTFLWFGIRAFGGPVAQIAMMKDELVVQQKWVSVAKFNRVLAVYQILPGPEATELACYFGLIARGRIGAVLGGLGFCIPGFVILMALSWFYTEYGLTSSIARHSLRTMQLTVSAMIIRACFKLADTCFMDAESKKFSWLLGSYGLLAFLLTAMRINFFISLFLAGAIHTLMSSELSLNLKRGIVCAILLLLLACYALYVNTYGMPSAMALGSEGVSAGRTLWGLFVLGLLGGLLTFGGAYTVFPLIYSDVVVSAAWLTAAQFLDAVAITNVCPTPLVMFVTMIGYVGAGPGGAVAITVGMFLPAFSFTIVGHEVFERLVAWRSVHAFLDGVSAAIIGLVASSALEFFIQVVGTPVDAVLFGLSLASLFKFTHRMAPMVLLVVSAISGQILFADRPAPLLPPP